MKHLILNKICVIAGGSIVLLSFTGVLQMLVGEGWLLSLVSFLGLGLLSISIANLAVLMTEELEKEGDAQAVTMLCGFKFERNNRLFMPDDYEIVRMVSLRNGIPNIKRGKLHSAIHLCRTVDGQWFLATTIWPIKEPSSSTTKVDFISQYEAKTKLASVAA